MKYVRPEPITRSEAEEAFASGDTQRICRALVSVALYDQDLSWAQSQCVRMSQHESVEVRRVAAYCLADLARLHGRIEEASAKDALVRLLSDPETEGEALDVLDDFQTYLGWKPHQVESLLATAA